MKAHIDILRHINDKSVKYNNYVASRVSLPTCNSNIEWTKIIGYIFDFSYHGIDGYLTIVDYKPPITLYFKINDSDIVYEIGKTAFLKAGFKNIFKIHYYDYNVGDIVKNKEILDIMHKGKSIVYKYRCLNDGYISFILQSNLKRNTGLCEVCTNDKVLVGYNDIPTTDPWMIPYFKGGYDEAKMYVSSSNEYKELQCPHCGRFKKMAISTLYRFKNFSCVCSDGIPLPEKYMINLLEELSMNYEYQCGSSVLPWIDNKYHYDFYIPRFNMIIETNGKQHYKETSAKSKWTSLVKVQERDLYKRNVAMSNGIEHYIEIDCSESNIEKFKDSIMKSILSNLFNFNEHDIEWKKIDQQSTRNIVKEICVYKEKHPYMTPTEIAEVFHIRKKNLPNYYKTGEKFGWCTYNVEEVRWVANFHRNTHYCINGYYFYNSDDIEKRSEEVLGFKLHGGAIRTFMLNHPNGGLFKKSFFIEPLSHKEYLIKNKKYPSFITENLIRGLQEKYNFQDSQQQITQLDVEQAI